LSPADSGSFPAAFQSGFFLSAVPVFQGPGQQFLKVHPI